MKMLKNFTLVIFLIFSVGCINSNSSADSNKFDLNSVKFDDDTYASVIIGGGFGGLTSGLYLAQANIKHLLIQGKTPGGAITASHSVCNWPGEKNISGEKLAENIVNHAKSSGVNIIDGKVKEVDFSVWPYLVKIDGSNKKVVKALSVILATGAKPIFLNIPGEQKYFGKGVSKCATCDGPFYKDKIVVVIGGGNTAITDAAYLSNIAKKVYLIVRRNKLRAIGKFVDDLISKSNVEILYNTNVKEVIGDGNNVTSLKIYNNQTNKISSMNVDGMFLAIGAIPNSKLFKNKLEMDSKGYVLLTKDQQTSKDGVFAVGDLVEPEYKQLIIAAGEGAKAAMQTQKFLESIGFSSSKFTNVKSNKEKVSHASKAEEKTEKQALATNKIPAKKITFGSPVEVFSAEEFKKEVLDYKGNVVVDLYAHWCYPCKLMLPIVAKMAKDLPEIKFVKIDVSKIQEVGAMFQVRGVPTFMFFKDGKDIERFSGGRDEDTFKALISEKF